MKRFFIVALFLVPAFLCAQTDYSYSGYVVDMPAYITLSGSDGATLFTSGDVNRFINLSRFRFSPRVYFGDNTRLNIEYEIDMLANNRTVAGLVAVGGASSRQYFDLNWNLIDEENFLAIHYLDRIYLRYGFNKGNIKAGRQRIDWGSGRIWNPTDLFNPIDPANFFKKEKDGADAVVLDYFFGPFSDLEIVLNPAKNRYDNSKDFNFAARYRTNYKKYDISGIAGKFGDTFVTGWDITGSLFEAGLRSEGVVAFPKDGKSYTRFILGADNQFTPEFYALVEYKYNGAGEGDKSGYNFSSLYYNDLPMLNLGKHYLNVSGDYIFTPLLSGNVAVTTNIKDGSGYVNLSGNYSLTEDIYLTGGAQVTYGGSSTEYSYYPNAYYLQGEYYF